MLKLTFPDRFGWVDLGSLLTFSSHMSLSVLHRGLTKVARSTAVGMCALWLRSGWAELLGWCGFTPQCFIVFSHVDALDGMRLPSVGRFELPVEHIISANHSAPKKSQSTWQIVMFPQTKIEWFWDRMKLNVASTLPPSKAPGWRDTNVSGGIIDFIRKDFQKKTGVLAWFRTSTWHHYNSCETPRRLVPCHWKKSQDKSSHF